MRKNQLCVEQLEQRDCFSISTLSASGVLTITGADQGDYVRIYNPNPNTVEVFDAPTGKTVDFAASAVQRVIFLSGRGDTTVYQQASLTATLQAGSGPNTYVLVATAGTNTLVGGSNPANKTLESATGNGQTFLGGAGDNNIFGGGSDTIISAGKMDRVYDIIGTSTVNVAGPGYVLTDATSNVLVGPNVQVVTFFQPALATQPVVLRKDVNGNGIVYLNPQDISGDNFFINQIGQGPNALVMVTYVSPVTGSSSFFFQRSQVQWLASFGRNGGNSYWDNNTSINDVFYGRGGGNLLYGGTGINVLKSHQGGDLLYGRGTYNDLFAGPGAPATLIGSPGQGVNVFRNNFAALNTIDTFVGKNDVVIGVPASSAGSFFDPNDTDTTADNDDYAVLAALLARKKS